MCGAEEIVWRLLHTSWSNIFLDFSQSSQLRLVVQQWSYLQGGQRRWLPEGDSTLGTVSKFLAKKALLVGVAWVHLPGSGGQAVVPWGGEEHRTKMGTSAVTDQPHLVEDFWYTWINGRQIRTIHPQTLFVLLSHLFSFWLAPFDQPSSSSFNLGVSSQFLNWQVIFVSTCVCMSWRFCFGALV